jgi:excisionase family DNA binding protein
MSEEWLLTIADVAETLGCSLDQVETLIAEEKLAVAPGPIRRVAHTELREFVTSMQSGALALGVTPLPVQSLLASQPVRIRHEDETAG